MTRPGVSFPRKTQILFKPRRWKILRGGRGGAKSWQIARALILIAAANPKLILCGREFQKSIQESVHRLLAKQIKALGYQHFFDIQKTTIVGRNGSQFIFAGLRNNIDNIKSVEDVDICWIEEGSKISVNSLEKLIPTIRKEGSEIWVSYNPDEEKDPIHVMANRFLAENNPDACVIEINWQDNPWFPEVLRKEKDYLYLVDPEAAQHVWGGACNTRSDAQIFKDKYVVEDFEPQETWDGPYFGLDFGFGSDPAACTKTWIAVDPEHRRRLYIEYAVFGFGLKNDELDKLIRTIPGAGTHVIRGDNSRPETIAHLSEDFGLLVVACKKWTGCVEDGIQYLRSFERIVIHPTKCHPMMLQEARLYRYKVDRVTEDVLPIIVDKHNHGWDSVRYGQEPAILREHEEVVVVNGAGEVQISEDLDELDTRPDW